MCFLAKLDALMMKSKKIKEESCAHSSPWSTNLKPSTRRLNNKLVQRHTVQYVGGSTVKQSNLLEGSPNVFATEGHRKHDVIHNNLYGEGNPSHQSSPSKLCCPITSIPLHHHSHILVILIPPRLTIL
jgi:hypothetical protein